MRFQMGCSCKKVVIFRVLLSFSLLSSGEVDLDALLTRQEQQLNKLEGLVDSLSRSVSLLESSISKPLDQSNVPSCPINPTAVEKTIESARTSFDSVIHGKRVSGKGGIAVTKHKPSWLERFQFLAAAKLEASPTAAVLLPFEDQDGLAKYFAVGDSNGMVYVFSSLGDILVDTFEPTGTPVTAMASYFSLRRNESFLLTGYGDGSIVPHRIWESIGDDSISLSLSKLRVLVGSTGTEDQGVALLEVNQIGRMRYVVATDDHGRIRVFSENGKLYGTIVTSGKILAFMRQKMLFLTENTAGWLDLRKMAVKEFKCEGLNGSVAKSYAFDASERSKAYGFTSTGDLIHVFIVGNAGSLKCRVRAARKTDIDGPVSMHALKGYLLVANNEKVFLYNVSFQYYGRVVGPRPLITATLEDIRSVFANSGIESDRTAGKEKPLVAGGREKLVILGLGGGYIGVYQPNLPIFKTQTGTVLWSTPLLLFLVFLMGIWYFTVKKRESLGLSPEEAFSPTAATSSSILKSTGGGERAFTEDQRDARGSVLRGSTRRYSSPLRYATGNAIPYRRASAEPGPRGGADLKLRAQAMEPPGFPKRRETIFTNTQDLR